MSKYGYRNHNNQWVDGAAAINHYIKINGGLDNLLAKTSRQALIAAELRHAARINPKTFTNLFNTFKFLKK